MTPWSLMDQDGYRYTDIHLPRPLCDGDLLQYSPYPGEASNREYRRANGLE